MDEDDKKEEEIEEIKENEEDNPAETQEAKKPGNSSSEGEADGEKEDKSAEDAETTEVDQTEDDDDAKILTMEEVSVEESETSEISKTSKSKTSKTSKPSEISEQLDAPENSTDSDTSPKDDLTKDAKDEPKSENNDAPLDDAQNNKKEKEDQMDEKENENKIIAMPEAKISDADQLAEKNTETEKKTDEKKHSHNSAAVLMSSLALLLGCGGFILGGIAYYTSSKPVTYLSSGTDGNSANFTEGSIADVAESVSKSVVSIVTEITSTNVFGQTYSSGAAGTGIIASSDGYIITNKHVVSGSTSVTVVLDDGTTYGNVKVVATDPLNDVAYLKIDGVTDLPAATLGNSNTVTVGEQVIAIGNALGEYQNTVTSGIISGTGRTLTATDESGSMSETLSGMFQTDAAINGGNSGGPLVNAAGEVIGINTAYSSSAENMGFAIPIASAKGMLEQLIETGSAERAYIGVYNTQITPEIAKEYNLPVSSGVYLYSSSSYTAIVANSPAAKAGLQDKDIITKVNGVEVGPSGSLSNIIGEYKPGDTVDLTVIRSGQEISVKVTLEGYVE